MYPVDSGKAMLRTLADNPVLTALTGVTGALATIQQFVGSTGLPPFLTDLLTSGLIAVCGGFWILRMVPPPEMGSLVGHDGNMLVRRRSRAQMIPSVVCACGSAMLVGWWARAPAYHSVKTMITGRWQICGEFHSRCGRSACLRFLDADNRPSLSSCTELMDDSGYARLTAPSFISYAPRFATAMCDGVAGVAVRLPDEILDGSCGGRVTMR